MKPATLNVAVEKPLVMLPAFAANAVRVSVVVVFNTVKVTGVSPFGELVVGVVPSVV